MSSPDFVTFDVETTGLWPKRDRIIEVGIVRTSRSGRLIEEFSTLINPKRDIGPTEIHGITAGDVLRAPAFAEIVGAIAELINGCILVAHNASFDRRFLLSELERAGRNYGPIDVVCTLQLFRLSYRGGPRRLADCCSEFGIELEEAHQAINDARATSLLFHHLLGSDGLPFSPNKSWIDPLPVAVAQPLNRGLDSPRAREATYVRQLVQKLPAHDDAGVVAPVDVAQYLNFLDRVLEDRAISIMEADELFEFASELSLTPSQVEALHASYLTGLCLIARRDGVVTDVERADLRSVATLLGIVGWEQWLEDNHLVTMQAFPRSSLMPGLSVCFTGGREADKKIMATTALSKGLIVKNNVSRSLDILVLADTDSQSGKARKAREYGIRMIAASVFWDMLEEMP